MIKENDLIEFIADLLEVDPQTLGVHTQRDELVAWDSLHHLRIILELETEYGVRVPIEEVSQIKCINDFFQYLPDEK